VRKVELIEKDKKLGSVCEGLLQEYESFISRTEESSSKTSHLNIRFEENKESLEQDFETLKEKTLQLEAIESKSNAESRRLNERLEKLESRSRKLQEFDIMLSETASAIQKDFEKIRQEKKILIAKDNGKYIKNKFKLWPTIYNICKCYSKAINLIDILMSY
jgi:uncharacterized protein (DUF3084 family)